MSAHANHTQISAFVTNETKARLEAYVRQHGVKRSFLIERALEHHLAALEEIPADVARLAVDRRMQRQGIARQLLRAVFLVAQEMATRVGCVGVLVDAKHDAVAFYRRYGFEELAIIEGRLGDRPAPVGMFVALGSIPGT